MSYALDTDSYKHYLARWGHLLLLETIVHAAHDHLDHCPRCRSNLQCSEFHALTEGIDDAFTTVTDEYLAILREANKPMEFE